MTPAGLGFRMPAEWERHEATWIAWPHNADDWPGRFEPIAWVYADIVRHLHTGEKVHILVNDLESEKRASGILTKVGVDLKQVRFFHLPTDRVWTRDFGPIFVKHPDGRVGFTNWRFNGWAKYDNWHRDDAIPDQLEPLLNMPGWKPTLRDIRVVCEGGSIDVNGQGLLLTTEECLLSPIQQRNPELSKEEIERVFADYLGICKVLWLGNGIAGDDTHGHVDDITRFVAANRIVSVEEKNTGDPNHQPLQENLRRLEGMTDEAGKSFEVIRLPMPEPVIFQDQRLPASYANFYIGNEKVLVPTFNDPSDRIALGILAEQFPGREVVGIHSLDLVWGLGTLHCMTQQQPA